MVKNQKLWREIQLQYAKLCEDELGSEVFAPPPSSHSPRGPAVAAGSESGTGPETGAVTAVEGAKLKPLFYRNGLELKHWVLTCCALVVMCEWLDRSVLSIALESMKPDFQMNDVQVGLLASSSLWIVPLATGPVGRLADRVPRAKLLGAGVFLWSLSTLATGLSGSFEVAILCRLAAGVANCAGYPVALALLCDHFAAEELSTAMGFYHAGSALGGLVGFALGGSLISKYGWRSAFALLGAPQVAVSFLLLCTVPNSYSSKPDGHWASDLKALLKALLSFGSAGITLRGATYLACAWSLEPHALRAEPHAVAESPETHTVLGKPTGETAEKGDAW
eukprot:g28406.t1